MMGGIKHTFWDIPKKLRSVAVPLTLLVLSCNPLFPQEQLLPVFHFKALEGFGPECLSSVLPGLYRYSPHLTPPYLIHIRFDTFPLGHPTSDSTFDSTSIGLRFRLVLNFSLIFGY